MPWIRTVSPVDIVAISGAAIGAINALCYSARGSSSMVELWRTVRFRDVVAVQQLGWSATELRVPADHVTLRPAMALVPSLALTAMVRASRTNSVRM